MRDGWIEATLGETADFINGYPFKPAELTGRGRAVIRIKQLLDPTEVPDLSDVDVPDRCALEDGDLVFSWSGTLAVRIWGRGPALLNQHLFRVVERDGVDRAWLAYALQHAIADLETKLHGTTMKHITKGKLLAHPILIPPLAEQRRIVDLIAAVDENIEAAERVLQTSTALVSAVENEHFNSTGSLPVTEVTSFAGGYAFPDRFQGRNNGEIPVFKVSDMNADGNSIELGVAANYVSIEDIKTMRARVWPAGTVVFPKVGAALLTEKRRILATDAAFDNNIMGLVPGPGLRPRYLLAFLRTVKLGEFAQHGAVPSVNQKHFAELCLDVPDLTEQDDLVARIKGVQGVAETARSYAESLRSTRSALLSDLLSGTQEIPESYDALLEDVA